MKLQKVNGCYFDSSEARGDFHNGRRIFPLFENFTSVADYERVGLKGYAPMTAKEIETEEQQDLVLNDPNYIVEEKFDGTRATLYFLTPKKLKRKGMSDRDYYFNRALLSGSGFEHGKYRILNFFNSHSSATERVKFLKDEYGTGGQTLTVDDNWDNRGFVNYNSSDYRVSRPDGENKYSWAYVANGISELIQSGHYYPQKAYTRCFSRRISQKTGWYCENSDLVPHLRDLCIPELDGTVIDGEMFIPGRPFKDVSSTLNCNWEKALDRQIELGSIVFHAFDILFYKGIDLRKMPLRRRKVYLKLVVEKANSKYIKLVDYQKCGGLIDTTPYEESHGNVYDVLKSLKNPSAYPHFAEEARSNYKLTPRAFYEYIVATGGEGVMAKPIDGKYFHKRGREYQKIKKFLTREVIIMGFNDPTDEYKGKFPTVDKWDYWETNENDILDLSECTLAERKIFEKNWYPDECRPVSKFYAKQWIGTIRFGVVITPEEMHKLPKNKKFNIEELIIEGDDVLVLEVGECSGFDEEMREYLSENSKQFIGSVIEVKANEIFKDTGKLRHPRFMRLREDKSPLECTYRDHISD